MPGASPPLQIGVNPVKFALASGFQRAQRRGVVIAWIFRCFSVAAFNHAVILALSRFYRPLLRISALLQFQNSIELAFVKSPAVFVVDEIEDEAVGVAVWTRTFVLTGDFVWPVTGAPVLIVEEAGLASDDLVFAHGAPMVYRTVVRVGEET